MSILKSILVIYLGIYLILPGCLCQVLSAFGIDTNAHGAEVEIVDFSIGSPNLEAASICHCDDNCGKAAELNVVESGLTDPIVFAEVISTISRPPMKSADCSPSQGSRAPPDLETWSLPSYSGVYLL